MIKKVLIRTLSVCHLQYNKFKQNLLYSNYVNKSLGTLSSSIEENVDSYARHLCYYLAKRHEEECVLTTGDASLTFSGEMSYVKTDNLMSNIGLNILMNIYDL